MSRKSEEETIRRAWGELGYMAERWDWTAPRMLDEAERAEKQQARSAGVSYPHVEQLAGLLETAMKPKERAADMYGIRSGHQQVNICALAMREKFPEEWAAWLEKYRAAVSAFREARLNEKLAS
jgi:hypothetical protein